MSNSPRSKESRSRGESDMVGEEELGEVRGTRRVACGGDRWGDDAGLFNIDVTAC